MACEGGRRGEEKEQREKEEKERERNFFSFKGKAY